jgi:hypothetical protein
MLRLREPIRHRRWRRAGGRSDGRLSPDVGSHRAAIQAARYRALLAANAELMPPAERKMVPTEADLVVGGAAALERFDPIDR